MKNALNFLFIVIVFAIAFNFFHAAKIYAQSGISDPNIVLGRPSDKSVTMSILSDSNIEAYIVYGISSGDYADKTDIVSIQANTPLEVLIGNLQTDSRYYYRIKWRQSGTTPFITGEEHSFHTKRQIGKAFTFTVQADPHYGESNFNAGIYRIALQNALKDTPDFHIDLGDTFMTEKYARNSYEQVLGVALAHRPYFGMIAHSAPLFLVNGNHEGELGWELKDNENNIAFWSVKARHLCYPNPVPGNFYSGSSTPEKNIGIRDGYYAWEWGDALFVVLDPFWYTNPKPGKNTDNWGWTLGKSQYQWFKQTLEQSRAKFKFVFIHHLTSGTGTEARGGIEVAKYYEWGGLNSDNTQGFETRRPGWGVPIHQLMIENNVSIVFHGHDHVFVKQELDGIIYQECPQPSNREYEKGAILAKEGGYTHGDVVNGSGHIRITVSDSTVKADYIQAVLPEDENKDRVNGKLAYTYSIAYKNSGFQKNVIPIDSPSAIPTDNQYFAAGSITAGGNSVQLEAAFPDFEEKVNLYLAINLSSSGLFFIDPNNRFTQEPVPWKNQVIGAQKEIILPTLPIYDALGKLLIPSGEYTFYSLVVPFGKEISAIDWDKDVYDLRFFKVSIGLKKIVFKSPQSPHNSSIISPQSDVIMHSSLQEEAKS